MKSIHDYEIIAAEPASENLNNLPCVSEPGHDILIIAGGSGIGSGGGGGGGYGSGGYGGYGGNDSSYVSCPPATGGNGHNEPYSVSVTATGGNGKTK